jgi:hypothetical protein
MNGIYLSALPLSAKLFCTLFLVGIGLGSVAAPPPSALLRPTCRRASAPRCR